MGSSATPKGPNSQSPDSQGPDSQGPNVRSRELRRVLAHAGEIAEQVGYPPSSAHLLLALFTVPNLAELLLLDREVDEETLLDRIETMEAEPPETLGELEWSSREVAGDHQVNCLHLLIAITRAPRSFAYRLLDRAGVSIPLLRRTTLRYATHGLPRSLLEVRSGAEGEALQTEEVEVVRSDTAPLERLGGARADGAVTTSVPTARGRPRERRHRERRGGGRRADDRSTPLPARPEAASAPSPPGLALEGGAKADAPSPYVLNREAFRWLRALGRNLSHQAWLGALDPVIGRDDEMQEVLDILHKRRSNNPCLVGEPGVGKTAVVEGIAARLVAEDRARGGPPERAIVQLDVGVILAGTHLRGSLAERLAGLRDEVRRAEGRVVIFIDELHRLIGEAGGEAAQEASNELKAALARGEFPCIGATTLAEYARYVEADPALERRFTPVRVAEPDAATTLRILQGLVPRFAEHHQVVFTAEALDAAVRMARRYVHDRRDPDRTLSLLDLAGAVARRSPRRVVDRRAVAQVIARVARVPVEHLLVDDPQRFLCMEAVLAEAVVGHRHVLRAIAETIRRNLAGFAGSRPIGSFLLLGPTGVGKTEVVKALAQFLFGSRDALTRFDMSEFLESHSIARLIGAPPGYVGHQEGGQLTEAVRRRPYQVVLFDEIDKASREVWNVLLQVLDEGQLTDGRGRTVDFSNTLVVMTTNLGSEALVAPPAGRRIGFGGTIPPGGLDADREARAQGALEVARAAFPPELWNRIECRLPFHALDLAEVQAIAQLIVAERSALLESHKGITFEADGAAVDLLIERGGFDLGLGARPMRQTIARELEGPIAERILAGELKRGDHLRIGSVEGELDFEILGSA